MAASTKLLCMNEQPQQSKTATRPEQILERKNDKRSPRPHFSEDYQLMIASLRSEVNASGMQYVEIAEALGKPKAYLSKVLRGNQSATLTEIRNICRASGIPFVKWVSRVDTLLDTELTLVKTSE